MGMECSEPDDYYIEYVPGCHCEKTLKLLEKEINNLHSIIIELLDR